VAHPLRSAAARVLTGIALSDLMFRVSQVALPLVVLTETGSPALTGLSGGATSVPVLLSPWWGRRLRHRIRSGRAIAICYLGEAAALAAIPISAVGGALSWQVLLLAGVTLGVFETLDGPAREALVADIGDGLGEGRAFTLLATRDFFRRTAMVVGPAIGGLGVSLWNPRDLLLAEAAVVLIAAVLTVRVGTGPAAGTSEEAAEAPRLWPVVRARPDVVRAWLLRGTGCALWFAFTLGLALLGADEGRPGVFAATGLAAYGAGSLLGTALCFPVLRRIPVLVATAGAWTLTGLTWVCMGLAASLPAIAVAAGLSGVAVAIANGGATALIVGAGTGDERRALLAGQSVLVSGASAAGMLVGGPCLAAVGPRATLVLAGVALAVAAIGVTTAPRTRPLVERPEARRLDALRR
jgi:MFS family permease